MRRPAVDMIPVLIGLLIGSTWSRILYFNVEQWAAHCEWRSHHQPSAILDHHESRISMRRLHASVESHSLQPVSLVLLCTLRYISLGTCPKVCICLPCYVPYEPFLVPIPTYSSLFLPLSPYSHLFPPWYDIYFFSQSPESRVQTPDSRLQTLRQATYSVVCIRTVG